MPFVLGHALSMKAIHGGQANNDQIDSHKLAVLLRGGMLPQASGYPAERRAARDLLRRRTPRMRRRADLLAHVQHTNRQYHLPEIGKKIADNAHRAGGAERCADPAVPKTLAVALALMTSDDELLRDLERSIVHTAKQPDAHTRSLWQTVPGLGTSLRLGLRSDIHRIDRFPRVQACAASCRLVTCRQASGGNHVGPSGQKIGHAHLTWAFAEAAALCLRHHEAGQTSLAR
jgi:transposase